MSYVSTESMNSVHDIKSGFLKSRSVIGILILFLPKYAIISSLPPTKVQIVMSKISEKRTHNVLTLVYLLPFV